MYVRNQYDLDAEGLEGFWGAIGGGLKKVGGFVVQAATGVDISGGDDRTQPAPVISDRGGTDTGLPTNGSFLDRLRQRAMERITSDPGLRETVVDTTARYASPELLAAAAARQARGADPLMKASVIIPALAIGALLLRRR